jgi:magnesium transporter
LHLGVEIPYLRDVYDHIVTMIHKVEASSSLLQSLQHTYLSNVSIDVSEASNHASAVMKNLTAVATIILPLSLVAGLLGMNVHIPFQHDGSNSGTTELLDILPFIGICIAMLIVAIAMAAYFKKKQLL